MPIESRVQARRVLACAGFISDWVVIQLTPDKTPEILPESLHLAARILFPPICLARALVTTLGLDQKWT